ncbi:MAG: SDR family oxidoreductase, partial [Chloroflexi bacterium]|nr:SDR family oxidoreductase [Chloroflexota bacterium]
AAKEGIVGLARSAASEFQEHGITVNAVYPGGRTRMVESIPESAVEWLREQAADRPGSYPVADLVAPPEPDEALVPESNAPKIVYLCTDAASSITGQVIGTHGWSTSLYSPRQPVKSLHKDGEWTLDELERLVPISLAIGLQNPSPHEDH